MKESKEKWVTPVQKEMGERKGEMGAEERKEYLEEVKSEAIRMKELIEGGEAKDYKEAEQLVAKEYIESFVKESEYLGGFEVREKLLKENSYWRDVWRLGKESSVQYEILTWAEPLKRRAERGIFILPFEEALKETEKIVDNAEKVNKERNVIDKKYWAGNFFKLKVTPKLLDKFLESPLEKHISPNEVLQYMVDQKASVGTKEKVLKKYNGLIDFGKFPIFGKESIFVDFKDRKKREKEAVGQVLTDRMSSIRRKTSKYSYGHSYEAEEADPFKIREVIEFFEKATKNGAIPPDYEKKIQDLGKEFSYIDSYYSDSFINSLRERISDLEAVIEKKMGKKPEGVTGKGLEFASTETGARKVYLDGKLITSVANASFSEKATNGEVVAWKVSEVIDRDTITGTQNRDTVYVWKKGWKEPKEIFEDHAWSSERYFRVFAPEVTPDGKVKLKRIDGDKEKTKIFEVK